MGLEQGRLWALKGYPDAEVILYAVETGLPTLYTRKKDVEAFQKKCKDIEVDVYIVEVEIIERRNGNGHKNNSRPGKNRSTARSTAGAKRR